MGLVIVGGGTSSYILSSELRKKGWNEPITIISDEYWIPYNRVLLPRLMREEIEFSKVFFVDREWYDDNNITLVSGWRIGIDSENKSAFRIEKSNFPQLSDYKDILNVDQYLIESSFEESKLQELLNTNTIVFAASGKPFIPDPFIGDDKAFCWRTISDTLRIKKILQNKHKCLIIGGSFIALELVMAARQYNTPFQWIVKNSSYLRDGLHENITQYIHHICIENEIPSPQFNTEIISPKTPIDSKNVFIFPLNNEAYAEAEYTLLGTGIRPTIINNSDGRGFKSKQSNVYFTGDLLRVYDDTLDTIIPCGSYNQAVKSNKLLAEIISGEITNEDEIFDKMKLLIQTPYQIKFFNILIRAQGHFANPLLDAEILEDDIKITQSWLKGGITCGQLTVTKPKN